MFSIVIPTFNNINFLKICLKSLENNSAFKHEIIIHVNSGEDGTLNFIKNNNYKYTYTSTNRGLCSSVNCAVKKSSTNYILYAHDDMYFLPGWDLTLKKEIEIIGHNFFYLHAIEMGPNGAHIKIDCGNSFNNFDEKKLLENFKKFYFNDCNASHLTPHLIHKDLWDSVSGFSEEYEPGDGSDPDLVLKLWNKGVRYFKCLEGFRVYHFGSTTTRKRSELKLNKGTSTFIKKWGISPYILRRFYLRTGEKFKIHAKIKKNIFYFFTLLKVKIKRLFIT